MSRILDAAIETAIAQRVQRPTFLIQIELPDELTIYANSSPLTITWNAQTWLPLGCEIKSFGETQNGNAQAQVTFPGHNNPLPVYVAAGNHLNRSASIYMAFLDTDGTVLVDPELLITGVMSGGSVNDGGCSFNVLEDRTTRYGMIPRRWFSAENGFNNLPKNGQIIWWKDTKFKLNSRQ